MDTVNSFFTQKTVKASLKECKLAGFCGTTQAKSDLSSGRYLGIDLHSHPISTSTAIIAEEDPQNADKIKVWLMLDTHEGPEETVLSNTDFFLSTDEQITTELIKKKLYQAMGRAQKNLEACQRFTQKFNGTQIDSFVTNAETIMRHAIEFNQTT
ncbi:hypothetical protein [Pseudoalteromonas marina]|uniref:Uncharacterized protein n=1 Tax=Pseudoalteromonas marina TaxID=267375 RepID=A0ABT9FG60_9GAMM|nr:hypothetical protein [Pseudoalteromonas marina]MDP2565771.1 hypothetical protein [Pseudoalteromonas marina]